MQSITSAPRQNAYKEEDDDVKQQTNAMYKEEDEGINQQINNHNNEDDVCYDDTRQYINIDSGKCDDAAALLVMLYLLLISSLLVIAIIIGIFVVAKYGIVVLVAVCVAGFGMFIVAATVTSVITRDAKLSKARSKIKAWHEICKEKIVEEIGNIKEDFLAYTSGDLLLTYDDAWQPDDDIMNSSNNPNDREQSVADEFDNKQQSSQKKTHKPKSLLFKAFAFTRRKDRPDGSQKKSRRLWKRKKKKESTEEVETCDYEPPALV